MQKITVSKERFENEWEPTGHMEKISETTLVQTYSHKRFQGFFTQKRVNTPFGEMIEMNQIV